MMVVFAEIWIFRWIVTRMPVFGPNPRRFAEEG
jgi:hypothetical protein